MFSESKLIWENRPTTNLEFPFLCDPRSVLDLDAATFMLRDQGFSEASFDSALVKPVKRMQGQTVALVGFYRIRRAKYLPAGNHKVIFPLPALGERVTDTSVVLETRVHHTKNETQVGMVTPLPAYVAQLFGHLRQSKAGINNKHFATLLHRIDQELNLDSDVEHDSGLWDSFDRAIQVYASLYRRCGDMLNAALRYFVQMSSLLSVGQFADPSGSIALIGLTNLLTNKQIAYFAAKQVDGKRLPNQTLWGSKGMADLEDFKQFPTLEPGTLKEFFFGDGTVKVFRDKFQFDGQVEKLPHQSLINHVDALGNALSPFRSSLHSAMVEVATASEYIVRSIYRTLHRGYRNESLVFCLEKINQHPRWENALAPYVELLKDSDGPSRYRNLEVHSLGWVVGSKKEGHARKVQWAKQAYVDMVKAVLSGYMGKPMVYGDCNRLAEHYELRGKETPVLNT